MLSDGDAAPDVMLDTSEGRSVKLSALFGQPIVLYFYPRDDTSGCTREAKDFTELMPEFAAANVRIIGISKDSVASHTKFADKYAIPYALASDGSGRVCEAFGTWVEKSMYGRKYMGIDRATFLIDAFGNIARSWRKVKVPGHVAEVLEAARRLPATSQTSPTS